MAGARPFRIAFSLRQCLWECVSTGNCIGWGPGGNRRQRRVPIALGTQQGREPALCQCEPWRLGSPSLHPYPSHPHQHRSLLWDQSLGPSAPVHGAVQLSRILAPQTRFPWPDGNCCQTSKTRRWVSQP